MFNEKVRRNVSAYRTAQKNKFELIIWYKSEITFKKQTRRVNGIFTIITTCESERRNKKVMECRAKFAVLRA